MANVPISSGSGVTVATDELATAITGTVAKTAASPTLTGTSTLFTTQLSVGEVIRVPGTANEDRVISAIASDVSLTVSANFTNSATAQTASLVRQVQYVKLLDGTAAGATAAVVSASGLVVAQVPSSAMATATAAAAAAITLTLAAPGAGQFHYITRIDITAYSSAARTGAATPWLVTTTNITGGPVFTFSTGAAIGTNEQQTYTLGQPLKSTTANTATTFVCPAATGVIWRVNIAYYTAA